jgi:hypothetical protein
MNTVRKVFIMGLKVVLLALVLVALNCISPNRLRADIGQTFDLKEKRVQQLITGAKDSTFPQNLIKTDNAMINSYEETITRIEQNEKELESRQDFLVLVCILVFCCFCIGMYMVWVLNQQLNEASCQQKSLSKTISEIFLAMLFLSLPSKEILVKTKGIHFLIFICLIGMLISMAGYLIKLAGL